MEQPIKPLFENKGYFEDVTDLGTGKCLGTRLVPAPTDGRECGYHGQREEIVMKPMVLQRGHKEITVPCSPARPMTIRTTLYIVCGRLINQEAIHAHIEHFKARGDGSK